MKIEQLTLKELPQWWRSALERQKNMAIEIHVLGNTPPEIGSKQPNKYREHDHSVSYDPWQLDDQGALMRKCTDVDIESRSYCYFDEYWARRYTANLDLAYEVQEKAVTESSANDFVANLWGVMDMPRSSAFWTTENMEHIEKFSRASADQRCQAALTIALRIKESGGG